MKTPAAGILTLLFLLMTSCAVTAPSRLAEKKTPDLCEIPAAEIAEQPEKDAEPAEEAPERPESPPEPEQRDSTGESDELVESGLAVATPVIPTPEIRAPSADEVLLGRLTVYPAREQNREIALRVFPQDASVLQAVDGSLELLDPLRREKDVAWYSTEVSAVGLRADGYRTLVLPLTEDELTQTKLEKNNTAVRRIGELSTGHQPKSVRFSPDGQYLFTTNLGDRIAVGQYRTRPFEWIRNFEAPADQAAQSGFVETLILEGRNELWVSQMNGNRLHVFDLDSAKHLATIPLGGVWPKILIATPDEKKVYVSCWLSDSVVEIDVAGRREIRSFDTGPIPRGLALSSDAEELLVTRFGDSGVDRINLKTGERSAVHDAAPGRSFAMRHIVHDERRGEYYVTAMGARRVYRLSEDGQWLGYWTVGDKPNTCEISPDGRWLAVSCRGPNNPDIGYLFKGYEYGKVYLIDLEKSEVAAWIWGRDQPTGLDISPDGEFLAFTDFLSNNLELYRLF